MVVPLDWHGLRASVGVTCLRHDEQLPQLRSGRNRHLFPVEAVRCDGAPIGANGPRARPRRGVGHVWDALIDAENMPLQKIEPIPLPAVGRGFEWLVFHGNTSFFCTAKSAVYGLATCGPVLSRLSYRRK